MIYYSCLFCQFCPKKPIACDLNMELNPQQFGRLISRLCFLVGLQVHLGFDACSYPKESVNGKTSDGNSREGDWRDLRLILTLRPAGPMFMTLPHIRRLERLYSSNISVFPLCSGAMP